MTEYQIASAIENYVTSHEGVTDFPVTLNQIRDEVDTLRIRLFDEVDLNTRYTVSLEPYLQILEITEGVTYDEPKNQTTVVIPDIHIRHNGKPAIRYCGSLSEDALYKNPFRIITGNQIMHATHDQYIGNAPIAYYEAGAGKIVFLQSQLTQVKIAAIFTQPHKCVKFGYDSKKSTYPVPAGLADMLIGKTAETYMRTMYRKTAQPNTQADIPMMSNNAGS
jgi:hypothetical protein